MLFDWHMFLFIESNEICMSLYIKEYINNSEYIYIYIYKLDHN